MKSWWAVPTVTRTIDNRLPMAGPGIFWWSLISALMSREVELLSEHPIDVVLLATDMDASKDFYANKVGLPIVNESPAAVTFKCGGASRLVVSKSSVGTSDEQTQASFRVSHVKAEAAYLRSMGVTIQEYDLPGLKTIDGIADIGFALMAWFIDPGKNCVGMLQLK